MLERYRSETEIEELGGVAHSVSTYSLALRNAAIEIPKVLAMPLTSDHEADNFLVALRALVLELNFERIKQIHSEVSVWKVSAYLLRATNHDTEGWSEVLGVMCRTYTNLLMTNVMLGSLLDPVTLEKRLNDTAGDATTNLPKEALSNEAAQSAWGLMCLE